MARRMFIDRFDTTLDLTGKQLTYANVKARVLEAGRFSTFEASHSRKHAAIFDDLARDPDVIVTPVGYPWISVTARGRR